MSTLRVEYARAESQIRLGEIYATLAEAAPASSGATRNLWRQARDSLAPGVAGIRKVNDSFKLTGDSRVLMDEGIALLKRTETALAQLR